MFYHTNILPDISYARQFNENDKAAGKREKNTTARRNNGKKWEKKREGKKEKRGDRSLRVALVELPLPPSLAPFSPSHAPPSVKTMAKPSRRFPIISISLKYLCVWRKRDGVSDVDRNLFRSLYRERFAYRESLPSFALCSLFLSFLFRSTSTST